MAHLHAWMDMFFDRFRWYRRLIGGHWELWYVDVVYSDIWHQVGECSLKTGIRPNPLCRGIPVCEDHGEWMNVEPW